MDRKAVFVDVDGTLVNDRGLVPDSARVAVQRARANGHLVFLCTGRSPSQLWDEIIDVGFDGVIAAAGGYVEVGGAVLWHQNLPVEVVRRVVEFFDARGVAYFLEANTGLYGSPGVKEHMRARMFGGVTDEVIRAELQRGLGPLIDSVITGQGAERSDINKISFFDSPVSLDDVRDRFADILTLIPISVPQFGPNSGELALPGVHKASAIQTVIEHLGIDRADTLALGDGFNDLEMLAHVGVGIAMGNAPQQVKDVADDTTGSPDEDGLLTTFTKYGLI